MREKIKRFLKKLFERLLIIFVLLAIGDQMMVTAIKHSQGMNRLLAELPGIALIMIAGIVAWKSFKK